MLVQSCSLQFNISSILSSFCSISCMNYSLFDTKNTYAKSVQGHSGSGGTRGSWGTRGTLEKTQDNLEGQVIYITSTDGTNCIFCHIAENVVDLPGNHIQSLNLALPSLLYIRSHLDDPTVIKSGY